MADRERQIDSESITSAASLIGVPTDFNKISRRQWRKILR